jgi:hypothetical protein
LARGLVETSAGRWAQRALRNVAIRSVPRGLTKEEFASLSKKLLTETERRGLGKDVFVQGSRASGLSLPGSDVDIAVRVSKEEFDNAVKKSFKTPKPGSAKERTMMHAMESGKISGGEAGLSGTAREVASDTGKKVQISVIRKDGPFDAGPIVPLKQ